MKSYKQLTHEQRCQIYALKKSDLSQKAIADIVEVSQSTLSRELKRNTGDRGYRHKQAQFLTDERQLTARKALKMTASKIILIESKIRKRWSPSKYRVGLERRKIRYVMV